MKNETMGVSTTPNKKEQKDLSNESKGINAVDQKMPRSFGIIDMWNLQKRQRTSSSMLRRLQ